MSPPPDSACLDDSTVLRFVSGTLPPGQTERVLAHMDGCHACLDLVLQAASATDVASASVAESPHQPHQPRQIDEFLLLRFLGRGASGQVYAAQDQRLQRRVALKLLAEKPVPTASDRFLTEARALARLRHPNVVVVHRIGEWDGRPYLVTELLVGPTLAEIAKPLPIEQVRTHALGLASGLGAAHEAGVLHRDIKPANVILTAAGVKLVDFGLAKLESLVDSLALPGPEALPEAALASTAPGSLVGTPLYMAPELWRGEPATPRSDVYALGALLYELCTGHPPHRAARLGDLVRLVQEEDAAPLGPRCADPQLSALIERCLARDPTQRPASAEDVRAALETLPLRTPGVALVLFPGAPRSRRRAATLALFVAGLSAVALYLGLAPGMRGRLLHPGTPEGMVWIAGGGFLMGSSNDEIRAAHRWSQRLGCDDCDLDLYEREQPQRQVAVSGFFLDATEVKNERFAAWLNRQPGLRQDGRLVLDGEVLLADLYPGYGYGGLVHEGGRYAVRPGYEQKPVAQVTWDGALRYCRSLGGRLPTEAEWEFAARGQKGRRFPWGDDDPTCEGVAFGRIKPQACFARLVADGPISVGQAPMDRSPEGVFDLAGNVAEWVMDHFRLRYPACAEGCRDPVVSDNTPEDGGPDARTVRGGAWFRETAACRATGRSRSARNRVWGDIGFRCAQRAPRARP